MPKYINDEYQNFMTNMECRITNQNQRMNIETHRHYKQINQHIKVWDENKQNNATIA
jgi:N-acetyl-gamma-glutamylphosphate reductase